MRLRIRLKAVRRTRRLVCHMRADCAQSAKRRKTQKQRPAQ